MHVVASETAHVAVIHHTLYKIISLHAIFVGGAVGVMREGGLAQGMLFKIPEAAQV